MHGISFGPSNPAYGFGPVRGFSGHHGISRERHDGNRDTASLATGGVLSNLSNSIAGLRSQLESLSTSRDLPVDGQGSVSASAMGATVINKQRGELQIHTLEGDVVTLKFSSKTGVSIEGRQVSDGDTTLSGASLDMYSRSKVKISVDGNLSDTELAAINNLVDKVGELTDDFFNGGMDSALAQAMSLSYDTSVLADYALDLSLKQSVRAYSYAAAWTPPQQPLETAPVDAAPAAQAIGETSDEGIPEEPASPAAAPTETGETAPEATGTGAAATTETSSPTQIVADFVAKVRSSLRVTATESSLGMSYEFKVKLLISSISESAPAETTPDSAALNYLQEQLAGGAAA